jgi:hypothetical protein
MFDLLAELDYKVDYIGKFRMFVGLAEKASCF